MESIPCLQNLEEIILNIKIPSVATDMNFLQKLEKAIQKNNSLLCIGLDPDISKLPKHLISAYDPIFEFNKQIIEQTHDLVCAYKPQIAYYSALGIPGIKALQKTIEYISKQYSSIPVILDAKRGDIGSTAKQYAKEAFDFLKADAVTVNPYLGFDSLEPFLKRKNKGVIILCRTTNPSAADFQDLKINGEHLYAVVAKKIIKWHKIYNNCLMVVGATWPKQLEKIRRLAPDMFFLVPGIGAQKGDLEKTLLYGLTKEKSGLIINVSRTVLYASNSADFPQKAREASVSLMQEINQYRI